MPTSVTPRAYLTVIKWEVKPTHHWLCPWEVNLYLLQWDTKREISSWGAFLLVTRVYLRASKAQVLESWNPRQPDKSEHNTDHLKTRLPPLLCGILKGQEKPSPGVEVLLPTLLIS